MDEEEPRALERAVDPWYDQRVEMPEDEFDGVDYFVNQPGRPAPPPPVLAVYLDSDLRPAAFADRLPGIVDDMARLVSQTSPLPMRPNQLSYDAG